MSTIGTMMSRQSEENRYIFDEQDQLVPLNPAPTVQHKADVAAIIVNRNRPDLVDAMVAQLKGMGQHLSMDIYVIEMGSDEDKLSQNYSFRYEDRDFRGKCYGHNVGLRLARSRGSYRYYWILMNDLVFEEGVDTIQELVTIADSNPEIAVLSPTEPESGYPDCKPRLDRDFHLVSTCDYLALLVRAKAVEEVGFLNPDFKYSWGAIHEFSYKLYSKGWQVAYCDKVTKKHLGGTTYGKAKGTVSRQEYKLRAKEFAARYFVEHYGSKWDEHFSEVLPSQIEFNTFKLQRPNWERVLDNKQRTVCKSVQSMLCRISRVVISIVRCALGGIQSVMRCSRTGAKRCTLSGFASRQQGDAAHPWFYGLQTEGIFIPDIISAHPCGRLSGALDLSAPILFLARGHSGTKALAKLLETAGIYVGSHQDKASLNRTFDSLYWTYGFQRSLVPKLFKPGVGCLVNEHTVMIVALECLRRHLSSSSGGPWGFKTCDGMFGHSLYQYVFPRAKYIYLVRDGRDVILSNNGFFHLTNPSSREEHWEYFKIITFGISNDIEMCPFKFPKKPHKNDEVMKNRYWIQAKSWREHVRMMEHLRRTGQLSSNVHTIRYEELCSDPIAVLEGLFKFLELELTTEVQRYGKQLFHTKSVGRWKDYKRYISNCQEDMEAVFTSMGPELELLSYPE